VARGGQRGWQVSSASDSTCATVSGLRPQFQLAAAHARHVEQVVHQPHHVRELAVHHVARARRHRRQFAHPAQDLQPRADRRQRIAQLVRERGDEFVLAPVGLAPRP
jgi:hypothetical protein